jgi:cytochrome oxidase assembly protein ShyY1
MLEPRRLLLIVASLVIAGVCVRLGIWQLDRLDQRRTRNAAVERGLALPARPIDQLIPAASDAAVDALAYRRAEATGRFAVEHEVVLYGRTLDGAAGNHLLTPLVMPDGRAVIIDRGWVPIEEDTPPVASAAPPAGSVTVTGVLIPPEPSDAEPATRTPATVPSVDLRQLGAGLREPLVPLYLLLLEQRPAQSGPLPRPAPLPAPDEGPHLSYAFQWFAFAAIALGGGAVLLRVDLRRRSPTRADAPDTADRSSAETRRD